MARDACVRAGTPGDWCSYAIAPILFDLALILLVGGLLFLIVTVYDEWPFRRVAGPADQYSRFPLPTILHNALDKPAGSPVNLQEYPAALVRRGSVMETQSVTRDAYRATLNELITAVEGLRDAGERVRIASALKTFLLADNARHAELLVSSESDPTGRML